MTLWASQSQEQFVELHVLSRSISSIPGIWFPKSMMHPGIGLEIFQAQPQFAADTLCHPFEP